MVFRNSRRADLRAEAGLGGHSGRATHAHCRADRLRQNAGGIPVGAIHAVIGTRRGAHLALSLERLQHVASTPLHRVGLSATQNPIEEVAKYLVGCGTSFSPSIIDEGHRRAMDLALEIPRSPLETVMSHEVWTEYYDRLTELIGQH